MWSTQHRIYSAPSMCPIRISYYYYSLTEIIIKEKILFPLGWWEGVKKNQVGNTSPIKPRCTHTLLPVLPALTTQIHPPHPLLRIIQWLPIALRIKPSFLKQSQLCPHFLSHELLFAQVDAMLSLRTFTSLSMPWLCASAQSVPSACHVPPDPCFPTLYISSPTPPS